MAPPEEAEIIDRPEPNRAQRRAFLRLFKKKYTKKGYLRGVKLNPAERAARLRRRNRASRK